MTETELRKNLLKRIQDYKVALEEQQVHKTCNYQSLKDRYSELKKMQDTVSYYEENKLPKEVLEFIESMLNLQNKIRII